MSKNNLTTFSKIVKLALSKPQPTPYPTTRLILVRSAAGVKIMKVEE